MMYDMCRVPLLSRISRLKVCSLRCCPIKSGLGTHDVDLSHRSSLRSLFQRDGECTLICWYVATFVRTEWDGNRAMRPYIYMNTQTDRKYSKEEVFMADIIRMIMIMRHTPRW